MKIPKHGVLLILVFLGGFSLGVAFQVFNEFIFPFSVGKLGDVASLISALAAVLTFLLGFYVIGQWKDQSKYAEEVEVLTALRESLRSYCMDWFGYVDKQFSEKNLTRGSPVEFESERDAYIQARRKYGWFWHQVDAFSLIDRFDLEMISPKELEDGFRLRCPKSSGLTADEAHQVKSDYDNYLESVLSDGTLRINNALKELRK